MFTWHLQRDLEGIGHAAHVGHDGKIETTIFIGLYRACLHPLRTVDGHFALQRVRDHAQFLATSMGDQRSSAIIFSAGDQRTIGRKKIYKTFEGRVHILKGREAIGMVMFKVGDHFDARFEPKEHAVIFIRFDHKCIAAACMRVDLEIVQRSTGNKRWIAFERIQHPCDHGGGSGLSVGSGNTNADLVLHQTSEEIGTLIDRDACQ